jgi:thiamine biosynthesis lipoprotein ApbE
VSDYDFEAMGCEIVVGGGTPAEHRTIERLFREREWVFSRFQSDSELNRVNGSAGRLVSVSQLFADTLAIALRVAEQTEGLVEPTLGAALAAAGYTRDFSLLGNDREPAGAPKPGAWRSVLVVGRGVGIPSAVQLDLNGVVKSLAVDDALGLLAGEGFVSAGGDLAARGELNVALPDGGTVLLRRGALATSGRAKRHWLRGGELQHHLIDPGSGRPADTPWEQVTACGASCLAADVAAKAGFLLGERGPAWLDRRAIPARFLSLTGDAVVNEAWQRSMTEAVACT